MDLNDQRPWGYFEVLSDAPGHKVKKIVVSPGGCLSLQRHKYRSEHWVTVAGIGIATVDGKAFSLCSGQTTDIPSGAAHRLENTSSNDLVVIEVQTGTYFGEDDIERLEDRYGRA
ncbi:MAG: phosphomannose isomerase type II C-terminal cupin domain [Deltaproteobacteria bacterium]